MDFKTRTIVAVSVGVVFIVMTSVLTSTPKDSTDSAVSRSGLRLYTDQKTGCQYVAAGGGLTPRLRPNGTPMCEGDV